MKVSFGRFFDMMTMNYMQTEIKKDILIYYIFSFLLGFYIANGTTVLFERILRFSYSQIFSLGAVYMLMFILFEVPSGAFADLIGRKKSVALGCFFLTLAAIATGISSTFGQVFASFFIWALGFSFISGAHEALLYDRIGDEKLYTKSIGTAVLLGLIGTTSAGILGPYLFSLNFRFPYLFSAIPFFLAGASILLFYEPKRESQLSFRSHLEQMVAGAQTAFHNKFIRWAMLVLALTFAVMYTMSNAYQPYLTDVGFLVKAFSIILPVMFLSEGLGGFVSAKIYNLLKEDNAFRISLVLLALSIGFLGLWPIKTTLVILFLYTFLQGLIRPIISTYSNRYIDSHQRATVISVQGMISTIAAALPLFLFGFLTDQFGLNNLLILLGALVLLGGVVLLFLKPTPLTPNQPPAAGEGGNFSPIGRGES